MDVVDALGAFLDANGDLNVDQESWTRLNARFTQQQLTYALVELKLQGKLRMPGPNHTQEKMTQDFEALVALTCEDVQLSVEFDTKYDIPLDNQLGVFVGNTTGCAASDFFHFDLRSRVGDYHRNKGIAVRWDRMKHGDERFLSAFWSLKLKKLNRNTMLSALRMRLVLVAQFRPAVAKAVYMHYGGGDVLDFCGGWGDRLCGAAAAYPQVSSFTVIEPRVESQARYEAQLHSYGVPMPLTVHIGCAEDVLPSLQSEVFDIVFTSPPYFDCEHYGDATILSEEQSHRKFRQFDAWLEGFLYPVVCECIRVLKVGGTLVLNVNDIMRRTVRYNMCTALLNKVAENPGMHYQGVWGYVMSQRMGRNLGAQNKRSKVKRAEPMYVWTKVG